MLRCLSERRGVISEVYHERGTGGVMSGGVCVVQHVGDLGNVQAGADGRAVFRLEDTQLKVTRCFSTVTVLICTQNKDIYIE